MPENDAQAEAFAVVREALLKTGKAAIGKVAFSGREHIVAVAPAGPDSRGMVVFPALFATRANYATPPGDITFSGEIKETAINEDALEMAEALIAKKAAKFDLSKFEDAKQNVCANWSKRKVKNLPTRH